MAGPADPPAGTTSSGEIRAVDGTRLCFRSWLPPRPRALLLLAHGLGEHSGRYATPAAEMARRAIGVFALDFRGHGRSGGQRGHVGRFEELVGDLRALRAHVAGLPAGRLPTVLLGHSLGGLIATRYLQTDPPSGLRAAVLSAPALGIGTDVQRWRRVLARLLSPVLPRLPAPNGLDFDHLSHDPEEVAAYRADPLVHRVITPRLFTEMEEAMRRAFRDRERIRVPTRVLVPGADRVVDPAATLAFCRGTSLDVRTYPGLFHEPLHEVQRREILDETIAWIEAQIG